MVTFAPQFNYRVFILDEVHALTQNAFNALLKVLEEPPPKIRFCLCTTDPQKFPKAILSRVTEVKMLPVNDTLLAKHIYRIGKKEGTKLSKKVCVSIARASFNSPRNALMNLEKVINYVHGREPGHKAIGEILPETLQEALGLPPETAAVKYLQSIIFQKPHNAMRILDGETSAALLLQLVLTLLRHTIRYRLAPKAVDVRFIGYIRTFEEPLKKWKDPELFKLYDIMVSGLERAKTYAIPEVEAVEWVTLQALAIKA
jgi:DNA polymerase III gamma/tau subunit